MPVRASASVAGEEGADGGGDGGPVASEPDEVAVGAALDQFGMPDGVGQRLGVGERLS
jgi:hypothetical protein